MRHYFSLPRPIPGHPGSMHPPTVRGSLPASARSVQRLAARLSGTIAVAVDLPAIAVAAHDDLAAAPHAHEQTLRPGVLASSQAWRRRGVDQPRPRQDTRPVCVLPGTVWGAASGLNCQVEPGAALTLNSAKRPLGRRDARRLGHPPRPRRHRQGDRDRRWSARSRSRRPRSRVGIAKMESRPTRINPPPLPRRCQRTLGPDLPGTVHGQDIGAPPSPPFPSRHSMLIFVGSLSILISAGMLDLFRGKS